jgi:hypothetical protein
MGKAQYARCPVAAGVRRPGAQATEKDTENTMGRFDSRNSEKMTRRRGQQKKKERLARRADAARASRKATKPSKKSKS